jgi:hypothetical protein
LLLSVAAVFLFGHWLGRLGAGRRPARRTEEPETARDAPPPGHGAADLTADQRAEIETFIAEDRKIEAIRACRAAPGLGFEEAHALIQEIERSISPGGARVS